ncbi:vitamin B12 ABC transporter ATP-binding protein BtuD [Candidatus Symbiopectobacterium sp. NZEC135]|uniref:vitamin B12 ABC transporter ATP-binding protein BtuD n=1 Tax=Candidatus Symbiopectobacterium sp. NZEC135 TaxID=2820471 RepID=UPI0039B46E18
MTQELKHHVPSALRLTHVACGRRLQPVSVSAYAGRLIHVVGPNGSGKSTLLARVSGLLEGGGRVELDGMPIADLSARDLALRRAYLSQQQNPSALMPVFQYLALHQPKQVSVMAVDEVVAQLATRLMLTDKLTRPLTELSGGEWQRVRLAAVFLQVWPSLNPYARLLVLDEPATGLDVAQRVALDAMLKVLCQAGLIVLASAHDLNHSLQQADDIWLISKGKLIDAGDAAVVMQPERLAPVFGIDFQRHRVGESDWLVPVSE